MRNDFTYDSMISREEAQAIARRKKKRAIFGTASITTFCAGLWPASAMLFILLLLTNSIQKKGLTR